MNRLSFESLLFQDYQKIFFMSIGQEFITLRSLEVEVLTKKAITYGSRISLWMVTQELSSWFLYWKSSKSSPAYVYGCKIWLRCRMVFSFVLGGRYDLKEAHKYTWLVSETNETFFAVIKAKGNVHQNHLFERFKIIYITITLSAVNISSISFWIKIKYHTCMFFKTTFKIYTFQYTPKWLLNSLNVFYTCKLTLKYIVSSDFYTWAEIATILNVKNQKIYFKFFWHWIFQ